MERELLLLGLLRQQDTHGYQLHEFINHYLSTCTNIKKPTAYALLDKMAERGWITIDHERREGNRPRRRVYAITESGEAEFQRLLRENLARHHPVYFTNDIGIAFLDALPQAEAIPLLQTRRSAIKAQIDRIQTLEHPSERSALILDHYLWHLQSELKWIDRLLERIAE